MNFEYLYKAYWDKVFRLCLGYFNDYALAQDLAQDVFVRVWQSLPTFKGESSVGTWIFRIATNVCLRYGERQERVSQTAASDQVPREEPDDDSMRVKALYAAIAELPKIDSLIISLYLEGMKQSEISQIIGISGANVRVRIHRIKSALAKKLRNNDE